MSLIEAPSTLPATVSCYTVAYISAVFTWWIRKQATTNYWSTSLLAQLAIAFQGTLWYITQRLMFVYFVIMEFFWAALFDFEFLIANWAN